MIWFKDYNLKDFKQFETGNIHEALGIIIRLKGDDWLQGTMPVDNRTIQPAGILHGGASVVLAESLGSFASNLIVNPDKYYCVGQSINANHIKPVKKGLVTGTATPIHIGHSSHIWNIEIKNEKNDLVCVARLTMAVIAI
jgi:1,4-dihydroxy-2-naphthoyl-CoA hydrolase